jgi:hypothetical protein
MKINLPDSFRFVSRETNIPFVQIPVCFSMATCKMQLFSQKF